MITKSCLSFTAITAAFVFLIYPVDDASALGKGGGGSEPYGAGGQLTGGSQAYGGQPYAGGIKIARKGGGGRGGGARGGSRGGSSRGGAKHSGGGYSRSGSAASGSFSHGSRHTQPTRSKRPAASAPKTASRSGTKQASRSGNKQNRKQDPKNRNERQDGRTDRTGERQDGRTGRASNRQQSAAYYRSQNNYYYGGGGYYHDHDDWDDGEVAAVALGAAAVGYAAGQSSAQNTAPAPTNTVVYSASPSGSGGLPCNPNTAVVNKITYYQCGNDWYIQAYGESGVIYMPVPAPH